MSGKYLSKEKSKKRPKGGMGKVIALILALAVLCAAVIFLIVYDPQQPAGQPDGEQINPEQSEQQENENVAETQAVVQQTPAQEQNFELDRGLQITKVGSYTGAYMEDGSDEVVSDILMIMVTNSGEEYIQYAEIELSGENGTAIFSFSTLYPGETMVVLEKNRLACADEVRYTTATLTRMAAFSETPSLCEEQLKIQLLDGAINVTNISGNDITNEIIIYYKNCTDGLYYGGITYRIRIAEGLKADETRQMLAEHFSGDGSKIMFVTCG